MVLLDISIQSRVIIGISAMVLLFVSFIIVFISNQRKKIQYHKNLQAMHDEQQAQLLQQNVLLEQKVNERTSELQQQKEMLQTALEELKTSQLQLIQKEKMASLGELTAGIAHEIQNPLNFMLNFGEINTELLTELQQLLQSETLRDEFAEQVNPLMKDFADNLNKILHHGKKADGIVKNMLQHTKRSAGILELTNINELADEYLKLSYHGFRSKHKSFNCTFSCLFDGSVDRISVIPQDIGQILMSMFSNAFYSMNQKKNSGLQNYEPVLSIKTENREDKVALIIADNGLGISQKNINKIFQPFFTTKPTGEATGLGLSLSYDMLKAHEADITVESEEGQGASFTILFKAA